MSTRARVRRHATVLRTATGGTAAIAIALLLAGCVPNTPTASSSGAGSAALTVAIDDDSCVLSTDTATAGPVAFAIANNGTDVNEFEILAEDKLRIVGEKENVTPGQKITYTAALEPGTYYTACKFQQIGSPIGLSKFTVTGEAVAASGNEQAQIDAASTNYVSYIKSQIGELIPAVDDLVAAYESGDDAKAKSLFASTRVFYERIEPTAESFGDLDPKIDYREVDAVAEGLDWTGFHRIEKDLWPPAKGDLNADGKSAFLDWKPSTTAERTTYGDGLVENVAKLQTLVSASDFTVSLSDISNGAIGLLDEVAKSKISGEEDWWSHTDLADFQANVEGAEVAYGYVRDIAKAKGNEGADLVTKIDAAFSNLDDLLATYGSIDKGFVSYDTVTDAQRKDLSNAVNALAEPLSQLTETVLGK
jgi:iron uptake system component EfeO